VYDAHAHVTRAGGASDGSSLSDLGNTQALIDDMDRCGVAAAAVSTPQSMGWDNSLTLAAAEAFPGRVVPLVRIAADRPGWSAVLDESVARGAAGVRFSLADDADPRWLLDPSLHPMWRLLESRAPVVVVHCRPDQLSLVGRLASDHRDLTVLIDHMAGPDVGQGREQPAVRLLLDLVDKPNVSLKTPDSSFFSRQPPPYPDLRVFLEIALAEFGPGRILWASDWPLCVQAASYAVAREPAEGLLAQRGLGEWEAVFSENFQRVFRHAMA
jgi:predicted TIM-barrel fold metal-dependent hydrolase